MNEQLNVAIAAHFRRIEAAAAAAAAAVVDQMENQEEAEHHQHQPPFLTDSHLYKIEDAFLEEDLYWKENVRGSRFAKSFRAGILYRPGIVDQLAQSVEQVLEEPVAEGIMVKGPGGIGKSHSLVNLVCKLLYGSNNKYLVTFIPDCEKWNDVYDLLDAICASFGISSDEISSRIQGNNTQDKRVLNIFIASIDSILFSMGKQWVFVFDQINKLFVKPMNLQAKDASGLAFPYNYIKLVMKSSRITSIISASTNNEVAYKENHEGFSEIMHKNRMSEVEIIAAFSVEDQQGCTALSQAKNIAEVTGSVPIYIVEFSKEDANVDRYESEIEASVVDSFLSLTRRDAARWKFIEDAAIACLLTVPTKSHIYDKKFFTQTKVNGRFKYEALVPQVMTASRTHLWAQLMRHVSEEEANLLSICGKPSTHNSARGQHFEFMVIQRCVQHGVVATIDDVSINLGTETAHGFVGRKLPDMNTDGIYFPYHSKFPAIDLVLKQGSSVFGVQIHVNPHDDVIVGFEGMCKDAGWFEAFANIYLVYLSPEEDVKASVENRVDPSIHDVRITRSSSDVRTSIIRRIAISREALICLANLQWPTRCSIGSQ